MSLKSPFFETVLFVTFVVIIIFLKHKMLHIFFMIDLRVLTFALAIRECERYVYRRTKCRRCTEKTHTHRSKQNTVQQQKKIARKIALYRIPAVDERWWMSV